MAINILGDVITDSNDGSNFNDNIYANMRNKVNAYSNPLKKPTRSDRMSPSDDLMFDSYQDAEITKLVHKLDDKKHDAVLGYIIFVYHLRSRFIV